MKSLSCVRLSDSLQPNGMQPTRLLHPWNFPGKDTGVGCHFLLQTKSQQETKGSFKISLSVLQKIQGDATCIKNNLLQKDQHKTRQSIKQVRKVCLKELIIRREQDGRGVGGCEVHPLSMDTSGIHLQMQNCMQNTS